MNYFFASAHQTLAKITQGLTDNARETLNSNLAHLPQLLTCITSWSREDNFTKKKKYFMHNMLEKITNVCESM